FEPLREIEQGADVLFDVVESAQLLVLGFRSLERDADLERNELRDTIHVTVRVTEHSADVANDRLGSHGSERDDLRDALAAVALAHVLNHSIAALDAEVDVE